MAQITRYPLFSHLRSEPNQHILHFSSGKLVRRGIGLAYWFSPLSAAVAQVPAEDCAATFVLNERTADFQQVAAQCTVVYRFKDPESAAGRLNFTLSLHDGTWPEDPLEKVAVLWSQAARTTVRTYFAETPVAEAMRTGPAALGLMLRRELGADTAMAEIGIALVSVQVDHVAPTPEVQKALETPTRESIQQKAEEAAFNRRALAVEKERAIRQNELDTQVDLAKRQDELIRQQGANRLREVETEAEALRAKVEAEAARQALVTDSKARDRKTQVESEAFSRTTAADAEAAAVRVTGEAEAAAIRARKSAAESEANATRLVGEAEGSAIRARMEAETDAEVRRLAAWAQLPPAVAMALGIKAVGEKIHTVGDINLTPDMLGQLTNWIGTFVAAKTGTKEPAAAKP